MPEIELNTVVLSADRIIEAVSPSTLASIASPTDSTEIQSRSDELSRQVANLSAGP
jgi:hypothetical protein